MLRKLLKYDFRESSRLLLPIMGGLILISIFGRLLLETKLYTSMPGIIQTLAIITYVLIIFICCIGTPIYFIVFFYRDLYTQKGYLIHTLPVTTHQKLFSKIITSFVMELLIFTICILSVLILLYDRESFALLNRGLQSADTQFRAMLDTSLYTFLALTFVLLLISMLSQILTFFAAVSIGQIFERHRILGAIAGYMILNFVSQIGSSIILIAAGFSGMTSYALLTSGRAVYALYGLSGCLSLLLALGCYMVSYYFMEKRLNLN